MDRLLAGSGAPLPNVPSLCAPRVTDCGSQPHPVTIGSNWALKSYQPIGLPCSIDHLYTGLVYKVWKKVEICFLY